MFRQQYLLENTLNPFALEKRVTPGIDFLAISFVVDIETHRDVYFFLLISIEMILKPNCCLLYFHSNDMSSLKNYS